MMDFLKGLCGEVNGGTLFSAGQAHSTEDKSCFRKMVIDKGSSKSAEAYISVQLINFFCKKACKKMGGGKVNFRLT